MEKRKTTTSTKVKRKYNEKAYDRLALQIPKGIKALYAKACEAKGVSMTSGIVEYMRSVVKESIEDGTIELEEGDQASL